VQSFPSEQPTQIAEQLPVAVSGTEKAELPAPAEQAVTGTGDTAVVKPSADASARQALEQARILFWQRDMRAAAAAYESVAQAYPDNADVWGEIGNFYYTLRQRQPASLAYARAIELLIDQHDTERASQLVEVLFRLDANKGRELAARLQRIGG
jgi:tetratricopeptide (TPR) repeat protein